ncbi:MAG: DMT family transporter [Desmonostoc vinosum HA7617-LM4]|jgi:drug/metabolite transporter (DMT)-like permease|nr:DMT family transporter [Desmonostoc vinosum HA7617-LM4]
MDLRAIGIAAALGSAASWAIGSILFKQLGEHIPPLAMTLAKGAVSVILLSLALVFTGYNDIQSQALILLIFSGLLGISLGDTFFFEALQDLGPHALVMLLMIGEVLTVFLAVFLLGETPTLIAWFGIALVIFGIGVVLSAKLSGEMQFSKWRGIAFGLLSVLCMSISMIVAKKGLESVSTIQATFIRMLSGTTGILFFGTVTQRLGRWMIPFRDRNLVYFFLVSVCVITFGGFWLSLVAIKYVDVSVANTLGSTEPLFILPLAAIFLKEKIAFRSVLGTILTLIGIICICVS